ncbi:MAG: SCO family protein [Verrucomicrobiae bacterium]|nr:SCO family protein [Verrucomicrobiae bacterium]
MNTRIYVALIAIITGVASLAEAATTPLPYYVEPTFTPIWKEDLKGDIHTIPNFSLTNQQGESVSREDLAGHIYVANFFFTSCPGICPTMTRNLLKIQQEYLDDTDVSIVSHSVTPDIDTVERLKTYAEQNGVDGNKWQLLTGNKEAIYTLARRSYFADKSLGYDKDSNEFLHTENFVLIDGFGHIRGVYNGLQPLDMKRLIHDINTLKTEVTDSGEFSQGRK